MFSCLAQFRSIRLALVVACFGPCLPGLGAADGGVPPAPLTRVYDIRHLSREDAAKPLPVKLSGVVLWTGMGAVVVHDGEQSIWVDYYLGGKSGMPALDKADCQPGSRLEIEGVTDPGGYAPMVIPRAIRRVGSEPLVQARRVPVDALLSGNEDGQRVEVEGVVQEIYPSSQQPGGVELSLMTDGHVCRGFLVDGKGLDEAGLVDARVRLRGIFAPDYNARAEAVRLKLLASAAADIDVLTPPPDDPFLSPRVPLHRLAPFAPESKPWHRKVCSGTVVFADPGKYFFLQDGDTGVRVNSKSKSVQAGQRVDVAGFVEWYDSIAALKNALVRRTGEGTVPEPLPVTATMLLDPARFLARNSNTTDLACRLVRISGRIQRIERDEPGKVNVLRVDSDGWGFPAYLPIDNRVPEEQARAWVPGAMVELTGVCELKFGGNGQKQKSLVPVAFHLLMPSPSAVRVLQVPSWWTMGRLRIALLAGSCVAIFLLFTTWSLRRQVRRQSRIIGDKIAAEAVHAERSRIARDLHDSIEQQLTGVSLHLYGATAALDSDPQSAGDALDLARRMLKHTQRETRHSIRDLRSPMLERYGLGGALHALAGEASSAGGPEVDARIDGAPETLPPDTQYQLLRLSQEALGNALKHAKAKRIVIELTVTLAAVVLTVTDDGCGFRPDAMDAADPSHFGMRGMQERAAKINARLQILSSPGAGTKVMVSLAAPFQTSKSP